MRLLISFVMVAGCSDGGTEGWYGTYGAAMNPENGWGSYESALAFLVEILAACRRHPRATLAISW